MYEEFYGLRCRPFRTTPDPEFLYWAESHSIAFTMLRYGLDTRAPLTVVTGEIGSGKTTLLRQLLSEAPGTTELVLVSNLQANKGELLHWVLSALGESHAGLSYVEAFHKFERRVIDAYARGRHVALIFDEAQNMGVETLEELRMLSNINSESDELLQIILVGQPQLRELINRPELEQFLQRISADFHLNALSREDVARYIEHRLACAGAQWRIFTPDTFDIIYDATRGVPRLINILCDVALVYGYAAEQKVVDAALITEFLAGARRRGIYQQFTWPKSMVS